MNEFLVIQSGYRGIKSFSGLGSPCISKLMKNCASHDMLPNKNNSNKKY